MVLRGLREFVQGRTTAEEIGSITSGRGLHLSPEAQHDVAALLAGRTAAELNASVVALRNLGPGGDLFHTAVLALLCGTLVEQGADAGAAIDATMDLLVRQLDALAGEPDEVVTAASRLVIPAAMAMLCRSKETRKRWRRRPEVMHRLDELEGADLVPFFLREVFTLHDDVDLLVLDPNHRRAYQFRLIGVRDRLYHCYALLQDALLRHAGPDYLDAEPVDPVAVRYARNHRLAQSDYADVRSDHARFAFTRPGGLIVPGSASPDELPTLDDSPMLVVRPATTTFAWNPAAVYPVVHGALHASVELIREFDPAQAEDFLHRAGMA
ncbi:hypothetical protein [Nocardia jejuensis]|uniref:hypothetical protein n=1 Tax=Nocardia jejuensis TaxID=328049 RepID=UPI0008318EC7|nr:hypothetical protein [Nocardia jejuensis]